jgi:sec-independent protein translocase protein TatC
MSDNDHSMSFIAHLEELRIRIIKILVAVGICFILCYYVSDQLFEYITYPIIKNLTGGGSLVILKLQEGFFTYLKISFISAIFLTSPYSFYQIWLFVAPGLYKNEKKYVIPFVSFATLFFIGGAAFCYFIVLPFGIKFFLNYQADFVKPNISIQSYFNLVFSFVLSFGLIFELPVVMVFLAKIGLVNVEFLTKNRKYAFLLAFIVGAILTPTPDIFNQFLMAVPLIILYELSIIFVRITIKRKSKIQEPKEASEQESN